MYKLSYEFEQKWEEVTDEITTYFRENPDEFVEKILGIKLFDYQKILLKNMVKEKPRMCYYK